MERMISQEKITVRRGQKRVWRAEVWEGEGKPEKWRERAGRGVAPTQATGQRSQPGQTSEYWAPPGNPAPRAVHTPHRH